MYLSTVVKYKFVVLVLYLSISIMCYFIFLLHHISEAIFFITIFHSPLVQWKPHITKFGDFELKKEILLLLKLNKLFKPSLD